MSESARTCTVCGKKYIHSCRHGSKTGQKTCSIECRYTLERSRKSLKTWKVQRARD